MCNPFIKDKLHFSVGKSMDLFVDNNYFSLTPKEKKIDLFLRQKHTLDLFLERNAISKAQYDKSLGDLIVKMGMEEIAAGDNYDDKS